MKKLCEFLREHAKNKINFEKAKTLPLKKQIKITSRSKKLLHL